MGNIIGTEKVRLCGVGAGREGEVSNLKEINVSNIKLLSMTNKLSNSHGHDMVDTQQ